MYHQNANLSSFLVETDNLAVATEPTSVEIIPPPGYVIRLAMVQMTVASLFSFSAQSFARLAMIRGRLSCLASSLARDSPFRSDAPIGPVHGG
jgi:hypothetical protein